MFILLFHIHYSLVSSLFFSFLLVSLPNEQQTYIYYTTYQSHGTARIGWTSKAIATEILHIPLAPFVRLPGDIQKKHSAHNKWRNTIGSRRICFVWSDLLRLFLRTVLNYTRTEEKNIAWPRISFFSHTNKFIIITASKNKTYFIIICKTVLQRRLP